MNHELSPETLAAQALGEVDPASGALSPAIHPSTIYERNPDGTYKSGLAYTRADNPTYDHAERLLAALEGGVACMLFGSGMAAATAIFRSLLPGDHVLVSRVLYWGVRKWLAEFALTWGLDVEFTDTSDLAAVAAAIRPGRTRLLWVETPANPMWEITDLAAACDLAHAAGVRVAVDNTVATPVLTRPFEAWLLQRGMRTLFLRVHRASQTALEVATYFRGHPALTVVLYPGLPDHPGHEIAARQMHGGVGGMLSLPVARGARPGRPVLGPGPVFQRATPPGRAGSLVQHR